jgi:sugar/nucleoside kinase (ribokinase family)
VSRKVTVFGFGSAALDFRIRTAELGPDYREKLLARETAVLGGGAVANALVQVSRLGVAAAWLGKLGADWIGETIISQLGDEGVDCSHVIRSPDSCSPFNVAAYAGEHRRRIGGFLLPNSLGRLTEDEIGKLAAIPQCGDLVLVEAGELPLGACVAFASRCREAGARVAVDVDLDPVEQCGATPDAVEALFSCADWLMPNHRAMASLYPGESPERLCEQLAHGYHAVAIVSDGARGAWWCGPEGEPTHVHAHPVEAVDTVGAGDAFHGGVLAGLAGGQHVEKAVALGVRCGAAACLAEGAREGMLRDPRAAGSLVRGQEGHSRSEKERGS